jgi:hypothetical protein
MAKSFAALDKAISDLIGDKDPTDSSEFLKVISNSSSPKDKCFDLLWSYLQSQSAHRKTNELVLGQ